MMSLAELVDELMLTGEAGRWAPITLDDILTYFSRRHIRSEIIMRILTTNNSFVVEGNKLHLSGIKPRESYDDSILYPVSQDMSEELQRIHDGEPEPEVKSIPNPLSYF